MEVLIIVYFTGSIAMGTWAYHKAQDAFDRGLLAERGIDPRFTPAIIGLSALFAAAFWPVRLTFAVTEWLRARRKA